VEHPEHLATQQIEEMRQQHIGRLLLRAHRSFSESAFRKLCERGHEGLGIAHTALLAHLDLEGTQVTVLAERAGITKQAMGQLVADLMKKGYVQRLADPTDRRATKIKFTEAGWQFLRDAYFVKKEIEADYSALVGEERMEQLRSILRTLLAHENAEEV
jgi:DNA-binding MarR family transcriptional regulator